MTRIPTRRTAVLLIAFFATTVSRLAAFAAEQADVITVEHAWARASTAGSGAAYVTLKGGAEQDALVSVSTPVAAGAAVHESFSDNGIVRMRPAPSLTIPAGTVVTFAPGGYHVMLTGLKQPLVAGQSFPLTLAFTHAAPVTVDVQVQGVGHPAPAEAHEHMHMQ